MIWGYPYFWKHTYTVISETHFCSRTLLVKAEAVTKHFGEKFRSLFVAEDDGAGMVGGRVWRDEAILRSNALRFGWYNNFQNTLI